MRIAYRCLVLALFSVVGVTQVMAGESAREVQSLDRGWLFHLGDVPFPVIKGQGWSYANAKAGSAGGEASVEYDDSDWRKLNLPHDWVVEEPFDKNENMAQGYRPRGIGWYRRYLRVDPADRGKHLELQFDGIATHATIWFNGVLVNHNWSGYNSVYIDITPYVRYGDEGNTVAVRVDANAMEGWWYEGAGIYRHTWLVKRNAVHIITDGVHADPRHAANGKWSIPVEVTLNNSGRETSDVIVLVTITDPAGKPVIQRETHLTVKSLADGVANVVLPIVAPQRWSIEQPNLYAVQAMVTRSGKVIDESTVHTGFRTLNFDADKGFFLNGQHVKLQGVAIHQDHAGVGVAVPDAIWEYRLRRLKELGANAIRFAHNAPAKEVLDMADRLGLLVMDENRNFNASPDYMAQLRWLVRRDRNHPSVILWSVFNEEPMQGTEVGVEMVRRMSAAVKELDTSRPVTAAMNGSYYATFNVSQVVDVMGINYHPNEYDRFHAENPRLPMTSSEDTSAFETRGEFATDKAKNIAGSYDDFAAYWGNTHRDAWKAIATRPFVAGGFVWTGFDYRGEPTPFEWPAVSSVFGIMDLCGFAKTAFYIHQAQWVHDKPVLSIAPHWNWSGKEGQPIKVMVMSNLQRVRLLLNGKVLGEQVADPYAMNTFEVPYQPGRLEAIGLRDGVEVMRTAVETTGTLVALELVPDRAALAGDGLDAEPITVRALDAQGRAVPTANLPVTFEVAGPGQIIGVGNGDSNSHEPEKGLQRNLFNGLAQLIVQSSVNGSGELVLRAHAPGLTSAKLKLRVLSVAPRPAVNSAEPVSVLRTWRVSPGFATRPDPNQVLADNDMDTWDWGDTPILQLANSGKWRMYRTTATPRSDLRSGVVRFNNVQGKAELWLNGKLLARKDNAVPGELVARLTGETGNLVFTVVVEAEADGRAEINGLVFITPYSN